MFQVHTFYEAVGLTIGAHTDQVQQERLIEKYMSLPNQVWDSIINQATQNVEVLKDEDAVKQLGNILKTNVRACNALGHPYVSQVLPLSPLNLLHLTQTGLQSLFLSSSWGAFISTC